MVLSKYVKLNTHKHKNNWNESKIIEEKLECKCPDRIEFRYKN